MENTAEITAGNWPALRYSLIIAAVHEHAEKERNW